MRFFAACLVTTLASPPAGLLTQEVVQIEPGQRVRVTAPELGVSRRVGTVDQLDNGVLTLTADSTLRYSVAAVTQLELYAGRESHPWRGAGIGFLTGYALGVVMWYATDQHCFPGATTANCALVLGGGMGAIAGTIIGALVGGFFVHSDKWEEVPLEGVELYVMPGFGRFGIGIEIEF